ncbi:hypothetical protein OG802_35000 [Streptomyces sp. NBC_00704]|uniref:hypothetical protein n=1 Tax=Streptomyces sp. NBC_00704 TaxID=2975809 RepID=UPI002E3273C1|nr:hypothetical protein [Streptomyces sp. NBC_00704]
MTTVRGLRADAPVPDHARLAPARQRLLAEIAGPRRDRYGWRLKALGAVAAVVAAASLSTVTLRADHSAPAKPAPRPNQWVYQHVRMDGWQCAYTKSGGEYSEIGVLDLSPHAGRACSATPTKSQLSDRWVRYDGNAWAGPGWRGNRPDAALGHHAWEMLAPQEMDALVATLPDDPDAALRTILKKSVPSRSSSAWRLTQAQRDFDEILEVLSGSADLPPDKARTIHRIIMGLDGVTEPVKVTDGAGRTVLAIGVDGNFRDYSFQRNGIQVLLDPETYAYRGVRWVAGLGYYAGGKASGGPFIAKGTVIAMETRVATEIVDGAGKRG